MSGIPIVLQRAAAFVGISGLGVGVYLWLVAAGQQPKPRPRRDAGQAVRVLEVSVYEAIPRVTGYGAVAAQRSWQGLAEVSGRVIEVGDDVQVGQIVREGTVLFKIDPEDLELEKTRSVATVKGVRAQIAELRARENSTKASLAVEEKVLALARKDFERSKELQRSGALAASEVDAAERAVLASEKTVVDLRNALAESPASRRVLEAQLEEVEAGVTGADRGLARAVVVAPFTMRISEVGATIGQAVSSGTVMVVADGVDIVEVSAQLPIGAIDPLLPPRRSRPTRDAVASDEQPTDAAPPNPDPSENEPSDEAPPRDPADGDPADVDPVDVDPAVPSRGGRGLERIAASLEARVRLESHAVKGTWPAVFARFAGVDPATRTLGVVVQVDRAQRRQGSSDVRLSPGLHVAVDFSGTPKPGCFAVPTEALHAGVLYVVGPKDRLELRAVEVAWSQEEFACIESGLEVGDQVVISELAPAVEGMRLAPSVDEREAQRIAELAVGELPAS